MTLKFRSKQLDREVAIHEIYDLNLEQAQAFHVELTIAILEMSDAISEAFRRHDEAGVPFDYDWMHKARKKRRITLAFATEAKRRLLKLEGVDAAEVLRKRRSHYEVQRDRFAAMRQERLRELLKEELGPGVLEEIECEAHEAAEKDLKEWLLEHGHEQIYVT
jgi:hypothetical protein